MKPELLFTQAGRVFYFIYRDKKVACNYYFTRTNPTSPGEKLWMNILFHFGEKKDVYEITAEQSEAVLLIKPKSALDSKVQKFVEAYLSCFL